MSKVAGVTSEVPEIPVQNQSQSADTLHRPDPDSDVPNPVCWAQYSDVEFTDVPTAAYQPHYKLSGNPECFGGEWS